MTMYDTDYEAEIEDLKETINEADALVCRWLKTLHDEEVVKQDGMNRDDIRRLLIDLRLKLNDGALPTLKLFTFTAAEFTGYDMRSACLVQAASEEDALALVGTVPESSTDDPPNVWVIAEVGEARPNAQPGIVFESRNGA